MKLLVTTFIILMIVEAVIVAVIAYRKGQDKSREVYKTSLQKIRLNYESMAQQFEEIANERNQNTESLSSTIGRR